MSALEIYCTEIISSRGILRQRRLRNLRQYLKTADLQTLIDAIQKTSNPQHLKILWEAGLESNLQAAVERRMLELGKRRTT
jgi:hypothetical protein